MLFSYPSLLTTQDSSEEDYDNYGNATMQLETP